MKILRIIARLNVGGPARHVVWLSDALRGGEFETELIAGSVPPGEEDMGYLAEERGVEPVYIPEMSRELSVRDAVSLVKVYRRLREAKPDVVHTHTAKAGTVGRAAAFLYKWLTPGTLVGRPRTVRVVHTFHGHVFHSYYGPAKTRLFLAVERTLARLATDRIVVISRQQLDEISGTFRVGRRERFHVIPLGIDLAPFDTPPETRTAFRRAIGAADDETVVGFTGRLTEIKNISLLLRAAAICRDTAEGPKISFVIAGDGHCRDSLEREAADLGISDIVRFIGSRKDVAAVYAGVDIVALTSLNEGTPLSLIEAMAAARPVVSTVVGGVRDLLGEQVEQHVGGFHLHRRGLGTPSGDPDAFAAALLFLARDPKLQNTLADSGRDFVTANYSKERLINDVKELYRSLAR